MSKRLHNRLAAIIIGTAACILFISTLSTMLATHYHLSMYHEIEGVTHDLPRLDYHLEKALLQSIAWTFAGSSILAILIGFYIAKRISRPLVKMKQAAERMSDGNLDVRVVTSGNDELADLGTSLNELASQLYRQEQLRINMIEDIAHELRTPLATLKSHMRAFEDRIWEPTPERIHAYYEEIDRLVNMVAELEDLTYIDSPSFRLELKQESLHALIQQGVELVAAAYLEKKVSLTYQAGPDIHVIVDRNRMIQVLVNLLSNALNYTPANGQVVIEVVEVAQEAQIRIVDTGKGINREDLPYIFERFYRADKSRNGRSGGRGLGLAIVKKLVASHGGRVWAESSHGTAIMIRLPKQI
ncbi:sensor histidine kinase [Paenibacillus sp. MMO-58]|uniref:sensor histidine kinase n=1 Tax=Paenibacillus sp. MMO-58 TaxID=3081290 RepID=UPI00301A28CD